MARVLAATLVVGFSVLGAFSACASSDAPTASRAAPAAFDAATPTDASGARAGELVSRVLPASERSRAWLERALGLARKEELLSEVLAPNENAWLGPDTEPSPLRSGAYRLVDGAQPDALFVTTRPSSTSPLELTLAPDSGLELRLTRLGAREVPAELERGRLVFADVYPATDVILAASVSHAEELLVLKDAGAPREFSWDVALGNELKQLEKQPDGSLLARSREGSSALRIRPAKLIDGKGQSRPLDLEWSPPRLTARIDVRGLTYPLLVDPMVETVLWEPNAAAGGTARSWHAAARLAAGGLVYGGEDFNGILATTLRYDAGVWSALAPATSPGPLRGHAMAFNGTNVVLFGGHSGVAPQAKTWLWTGSDWSERCTAGMPCASAPSAKQGHAMAFAGAGKVLLFGGTGAGGNETWEFSGTTWSAKCTACVDGTDRPSARAYAATAYAGGSSVLLFGGVRAAGGHTDETWLWNGSAWSKACAGCVAGTTKPPATGRHSMVWDEHRKKVLLFGGQDVNGQTYDDTWEWDGPSDEWVRTASSGPSARYFSALFYDMTSKRVVLFGGTDGVTEPFVDTQLYHGRGSDCASAGDCNTGFCKDGKCCETDCAADCRTCAGSNFGLCGNVSSAEDSDTCAGAETCNAGAVCKLKQGQSCTAANGSECATGQCVDGRCCESACNGACKTCSNAQGTCSNVAKLSTDNAPACSGNNACDGSGACKEANGQTCNSASECASGFCVDGRCCESSCTDSCKSCANAAGTCTSNVAKGATDTNASPACSGNNACDGAGTCKKANGQSCGAAEAQCASGFCADGKCCDTACNGACNECSDGSCNVVTAASVGNPSCAPYACNGSSAECPTTCNNDASCAADHYCKQGACVADEALGTACDRNQQCPGNENCVDGFCCDDACGGACKACSNAKKGAGADGVCDVIVDGGAPRAPGCALGATVCLADGKCNGEGACRVHAPNTTPCGAGTVCTNNAVSGQLCDGAGNCMAGGGSQPCAPAKCVGGACNATCNDNGDCHETGFCAGTVCAEKRNDGESCGASDECKNGHCVDGVCCNNACDGACQACSTGSCKLREAGEAGGPSCAPFVCDGSSTLCPDSCTGDDVCVDTYFCKLSDNVCQPRENGTPCTDDDQCPDRFCVDGVCCASACDGQCEHCDATGACVATTGAPVGERGACPGHADCAGSCDGAERAQCTGEKAVGTACGAPACAANIATSGACDASLACKQTSTDCDPYVCGEDACKTSCAKDLDCKSGFSCVEAACVPSVGGGVCDEAGTKLTTPDDVVTDCTPFICRGGECLRNCTSSTDCQSGFVCNTSQGDGVCESLTNGAVSDDEAGCGCRVAGGANGSSLGGYVAALLLAGFVGRRRRARAA